MLGLIRHIGTSMSRRYSDIKRGAALNARLTRYVAYLQNAANRTPKLNSQGDRDLSTIGSVSPFGLDLATGQEALVQAPTPSFTKLNGVISTAPEAAFSSPPIAGARKIPGFSPARIIYFENATKTKAIATSAVTGGQYLKYAGTRYTMPFGRQTTTSNLYTAFDGIRRTIETTITGQQVQRISLTPEKFRSV